MGYTMGYGLALIGAVNQPNSYFNPFTTGNSPTYDEGYAFPNPDKILD
jgi:ABC-type oligopeptide transport system substrate-binding subunit